MLSSLPIGSETHCGRHLSQRDKPLLAASKILRFFRALPCRFSLWERSAYFWPLMTCVFPRQAWRILAFLPCRARLPDASGCETYRTEWRLGGPSCSSTSGMASTYPSPPDEPFCYSSRPEMRRTHPCSPPSDLSLRTRSRAADRDRSQRSDRFGPFGSRSRQYQ